MFNPEQYWIDRGKDLIGLDVLKLKDKAGQASTYYAIAEEGRFYEDFLDIGCNVGAMKWFLDDCSRDYGVKYLGLDSNPEAINYCKDKQAVNHLLNLAGDYGLEADFAIGNIRDLSAFSDQHFECVIVKDVLEHLENFEPVTEVFRIAENAVILSFFIPPIPEQALIRRMEAGYYHNRYNETEITGLAKSCGFGLEKRIDTWETDGNMNRTYMFLRGGV